MLPRFTGSDLSLGLCIPLRTLARTNLLGLRSAFSAGPISDR